MINHLISNTFIKTSTQTSKTSNEDGHTRFEIHNTSEQIDISIERRYSATFKCTILKKIFKQTWQNQFFRNKMYCIPGELQYKNLIHYF